MRSVAITMRSYKKKRVVQTHALRMAIATNYLNFFLTARLTMRFTRDFSHEMSAGRGTSEILETVTLFHQIITGCEYT